MDFKTALQVWNCMYTRILDEHSKTGDWLFVHYNSLFQEEKLCEISQFLDVEIDYSFPDKNLLKNVPPVHMNNERVLATYRRLMDLSI